MTSFTLKIIAMVSMFCDHFSYAYFGHFSILNLIGKIAFPIFAFQISEGFVHTKSVKKYLLRLGLFALISQIPFSLFINKLINSNSLSLNVFFTLFLGLLSIYLYNYVIKIFEKDNTFYIDYKNKKNCKKIIELNNKTHGKLGKIFGLVIVLIISIIAQLLNTDYGAWGVILVFTFYLFRDSRILKFVSFFVLVLLKYLSAMIQSNYVYVYVLMTITTLISILFIDLYNGKQGKKIKYLLYWFYPIHLLALWFIF